jgi:hypothetical protein
VSHGGHEGNGGDGGNGRRSLGDAELEIVSLANAQGEGGLNAWALVKG